MFNQNIIRFCLGVALMTLSFVSAATAYYIFLYKNATTKLHQAALKTNHLQPVEANAITLDSLVRRAEAFYGPEETVRKEGFLWIDREAAQYVVTLGALNGILPGHQLYVYDGEGQIGRVRVNTSFDVISYVQPVDGEHPFEVNNYYRVLSEELNSSSEQF